MQLLTGIEQDTQQDIEFDQDEALEPNYKVFIHNDDVTPMDSVVAVLQKIFELNAPESEHVMLTAHITGVAYVTTLPLTEAQKRVGKAHFAASLEGYPLTFTIEPE